MKKYHPIFIIIPIILVIACTVTKNDGLDKNAKMFLTEFQKTLNKSDEEILLLFKSAQSKEEILKGIVVLQNKDTSFIKTVLVYDEAKAVWEEGYLKVSIPVQLIGKGAEPETSTLTLSLFQKKDGKFYIYKLGGQEAYTAYYSIKSKIENADELARRLADVKIYYDRARELQKDYDTVVWYVHHNDTAYYYAVNGTYIYDSINGKSPATFKMGLLHTSGKVIVPVEFDLVGNPSINLPNAVEVKKDGKIGYYGMDGKELVPVEYTWLVPYEDGDAKALVKKDALFGWLDKTYQYHENFPTAKAEKYIKDFEYLTEKKFVFGKDYQEMIKIPFNRSQGVYQGNGVIVPPAFLVEIGIFKQIESPFISEVFDENIFAVGDDYKENINTTPFSLTDAIDVFITSVKTRFIGGRGEFYTSHNVNLIDQKSNLISSITTYGDKDFKLRKVNEDLVETSVVFEQEEMGPGTFYIESNFPSYQYFKFDGKSLLPIKTSRLFTFTEMIKMDSNYLKGNFITYDYRKVEGQQEGKSTFCSNETIELMRYEILASYGFIITDSTKLENIKYGFGFEYKPTISSYDEVYSKATEIDKYNLDFLAKILGPVKKPI
jgi:hypothetical protein